MKIVQFTASNVKRLKAVSISPDGDVVVVQGRNAQGKTSVLDAIWLALGGGPAAKGTSRPIRDGETDAFVTLDLGDLIVTRTWTGDGKTSLRVENTDGARYGSPQSMLDALVGRLSFDPLTFAQQDQKSQRATLLDLVDLPFDPTELDGRRRAVFEDRTDVNRTVKALRAQLDGLPPVDEDLPTEEVSLTDLLSKAADARRWQVRAQDLRREHDAATEKVARIAADLQVAQEVAAMLSAKVDGIPEELPDPAQYDEQIRGLEQTNAKIRAGKARSNLLTDIDTQEGRSTALTAQLDLIEEQRQAGLADATMPIEGLGFDEDGVTYQGVPLAQASSAEKLRVSVAIAIAMNPKLRVIRITDGSLLDADNMRLIAEMAEAHDAQIWVERVGTDGDVGVVIEDGQVVGAADALDVVEPAAVAS